MIPGITIEEITNAFEEAFDRNDQQYLLRKRMSTKLGSVTGPNSDDKRAGFDQLTYHDTVGRMSEITLDG